MHGTDGTHKGCKRMAVPLGHEPDAARAAASWIRTSTAHANMCMPCGMSATNASNSSTRAPVVIPTDQQIKGRQSCTSPLEHDVPCSPSPEEEKRGHTTCMTCGPCKASDSGAVQCVHIVFACNMALMCYSCSSAQHQIRAKQRCPGQARAQVL